MHRLCHLRWNNRAAKDIEAKALPLGVERACGSVSYQEHAVLQRGNRLENVNIAFEFLVWILIAESVDIVIADQSLEAKCVLAEHHHCHGRIGQGQTDIL
jgi:hypothetical protein